MVRVVFLILLTGAPVQALGQAWTQRAGKFYVKVSRQHTTASEQFRADGIRALLDTELEGNGFEDQSMYLYVEAGLHDNVTAVLLVPYKRFTVRSANPLRASGLAGTDIPVEASASGVEKVQLGLRWNTSRLFGLSANSRSRTALNVSVRVPALNRLDVSPILGPGQVDVEAMLYYGRSFWPAPVYAQVGTGYRVRSDFYAFSRGGGDAPSYGNEWLLHGEAGVTVGRWALIQGLVFGVFSNEEPSIALDPLSPVPTLQRYLKVGGGIVLYPTPRVGLSLQLFQTVDGANTIRSTDRFFGLEIQL